MEYLLNEQMALRECYDSRPQAWSIRNCFDVAKKLHTLLDRDGMRLDCIAQMGLPQDIKKCLKAAKSFEQMLYKNRFVSACLER